MRLRVTRAALADLGLSIDLAGVPADELVDSHPVIRAFVTRRSQSPTGQEATYLPVTRAAVYNLHSGTARGLTWHDGEDVVWLLGVAWHRGSDDSDAYDELKTRDLAGELFPSADDYGDLEVPAIPFVEACATELPPLLAEARKTPGQEIRRTIAAALKIGLLVEVIVIDSMELTETFVSIAMPVLDGASIPQDYIPVILARLFPDADPDDFEYGKPFPGPSPRPSSEIVITYCS